MYFVRPEQIDQMYLEGLIQAEAEENIFTDFKRGDALKKTDGVKSEIAKDVSSFANCDGGIIYYGIEEEDHKAKRLVPVDGNEITKEWLEQVISSRIQRKIDGIRIVPVRLNGDLSKSVYVVLIPTSIDIPHQASNKKFYKRHNFEAQEMDEYEIRRAYSTSQKSKLVFSEVKSREAGSSGGGKAFIYHDFRLQFLIRNVSRTIERFCKLQIEVPMGVYNRSETVNPWQSFVSTSTDDFEIFSIPARHPIFPEEEYAFEACAFG